MRHSFMLVRNAHSDLRIVFESFVTLNLNTTEAYLLCLTKLTTTAGLKGFLLYIYGPEDTQTLRALKKKKKKIQGTLLFFGSRLVFVLQCVGEVPWMLRSAVNVKQEISTR